MRILIIDNYDSFTFNLYQLFWVLNDQAPHVISNDQWQYSRVAAHQPDLIVISPGPGRPERRSDFGVCGEVIRRWKGPLLGICLGHQGLVHCYGGRIGPASQIMHGRICRIHHEAHGLFQGIPQGFEVVRYHSLVAEVPLPQQLKAVAWSDDQTIMAVEHNTLPHWGIQFHPESISTQYGSMLMSNLLARIGRSQCQVPTGPITSMKVNRRHQTRHAIFKKLDVYPNPEQLFQRVYGSATSAYWLDSHYQGQAEARFSFMGGGPAERLISYRDGELCTQTNGEQHTQRIQLFPWLTAQTQNQVTSNGKLPFAFRGGFVGYLGYELKAECGGDLQHHSQLPQSAWIESRRYMAWDHQMHDFYLVAVGSEDDAVRDRAWLDEMTEVALDASASSPERTTHEDPVFQLHHSYDEYMALIDACLAQIREGESYEVCLTNLIRASPLKDGWSTYRRLRAINPAPFSAYLKMPGYQILCSSPEQFLNLDSRGRLTSKPIKGTRARGKTPNEDSARIRDLATNEKDRAENLMIVDLIRNDLGRVSQQGSVHVSSLMHVETYAQVHQLVSKVESQILPNRHAVDCIKAIFPGGSMVGAPKKRTMEIIDELEGQARGIYSGSIGYLTFDGCLQLNKVIRTIVSTDESTSIGIGGAIVAQSDPDKEFQETLLKGKALMQAIAGEKGTIQIRGCPDRFNPFSNPADGHANA